MPDAPDDSRPDPSPMTGPQTVSRSASSPAWKSLIGPVLVFGCLAFAAIYIGRYSGNWFGAKQASQQPLGWRSSAEKARDIPLAVTPILRDQLAGISSIPTWMQVPFRIPSNSTPSPSFCLHVMRLHGPKAMVVVPGNETPEPAMQFLLDSETGTKHNRASAIVVTDYGIRFPTMMAGSNLSTRGDESHRDQCLASLGELGIELSRECTINGQTFQLRDALADSLANFQMTQSEIEWTTVAYAHYLPPARQWKNRYGETFTFDQLAEELMQRPLATASCGGTHLLMSLTVLLRVDQMEPILSKPTRERSRRFVEDAVVRVIGQQDADGSWPTTAGRPPQTDEGDLVVHASIPDNASTRLLMTGHILEWLLYLPSDIDVPADAARRAAFWLEHTVRDFDVKHLGEQICPMTHAVCALDLLASDTKTDPQ